MKSARAYFVTVYGLSSHCREGPGCDMFGQQPLRGEVRAECAGCLQRQDVGLAGTRQMGT